MGAYESVGKRRVSMTLCTLTIPSYLSILLARLNCPALESSNSVTTATQWQIAYTIGHPLLTLSQNCFRARKTQNALI